MRFEFATATRILFGSGCIQEVPAQAARLGKRVLLVVGRSTERFADFQAQLAGLGLEICLFQVLGEPTVTLAQEGISQARAHRAELVIAIGGGSVIDTGKAIAAMLTNPGELMDYLEVVGQGKPLQHPSLPFIAIPTTAGTGAEVTRNAVLEATAHHVKVSLRSPLMLPTLAVVDPALTLSLPPAVTASCGLDALTQVIEPYVCNQPNPMTDALCREAIIRGARSLRRAYQEGDDLQAREDMAFTSLCGGLALANAKLGAVHGFAGPLGGMFNAPHGMLCARLLPGVMATNVQALRQRAPDSPVLNRFDEIARWLTGEAGATAEAGIRWVEALCRDLAVPALSQFGMTVQDIPAAVEKAAKASSMKGNPIALTEAELSVILLKAI